MILDEAGWDPHSPICRGAWALEPSVKHVVVTSPCMLIAMRQLLPPSSATGGRWSQGDIVSEASGMPVMEERGCGAGGGEADEGEGAPASVSGTRYPVEDDPPLAHRPEDYPGMDFAAFGFVRFGLLCGWGRIDQLPAIMPASLIGEARSEGQLARAIRRLDFEIVAPLEAETVEALPGLHPAESKLPARRVQAASARGHCGGGKSAAVEAEHTCEETLC
ncbi:hypothetical protein CYMTET_22535 [Cymbomonas tetramitiformis]|uniref:Uncharacterized protein n=1 Tax=Cymbomonas tetramitiformis TaxID=36881 RepID=A0AAE0L215_9CHLO|nr:hypothetical protein CYMTET_22535 [Cymbomonas tetramitiformis]